MRNNPIRTMFLVLAGCFVLLAGSAVADVINFDSLILNPPSDGRVPAHYGSTALVTVSYESTEDTTYGYAAVPYVDWWLKYGDLTGVAYSENPLGHMVITFAPAPGYQITLNSFDLGQDLDFISGIDVIPFYISDTAGPGYTFPYAHTVPLVHTHFDPNYTSDGTISLVIGTNWDIGIDNIEFTMAPVPPPQGVPEPASIAMFATGALALFIRRRK